MVMNTNILNLRSLISAPVLTLALSAATLMGLGGVTEANAQISKYDANAPMGWCTATSQTAVGYEVTGGGKSTESNTITLTSTGADMRSTISSALKNYSVIIFDGSKGDFIVSTSVDLNSLKNKTIIGINGARLCTKFYLTDEIKAALDAANVKSLNTSSGTGGTLSNKTKVDEECEFVTRQTLIDLTGDDKENHRKSGIFNVKTCENIIIRNLIFVGPGSCDVGGYDLISSTGSKHLWVDHCEFTDGIDGNFDITQSSDFNTVSWCKFSYTDRSYNHANTNLVGSSDTENADNLNTTFAYCEWGTGCKQRMPMARAGTIHLLNCYYNCAGNSAAVNPRKNSNFLVDRCYFAKNVKVFSQSGALSYVFNDCHTVNGTIPSNSGTTTVPYTYPIEMGVKEVPTEIGTYVGATLTKALLLGEESDTPTAIFTPELGKEVTKVVYWSLDGRAHATAQKGINIIKITYADGSIKTQKVIVR